MARVHGRKVIIKGFLAIDRKSLDAEHDAIVMLRKAQSDPAALAELAGKLSGVTFETRQTSYDPDAAKEERDQVKRSGRGRKAAGQSGGQ
jgi:hypothetical protein